MKRLLALLVLPVMAAFAIGATADDEQKPHAKQNVYFGFLLGSLATVPDSSTPIARLAGVAIDLAAPDHTGQRSLRGYVCDGFGVGVANAPEGLAVWFKGAVPAK